MPVASGEARRQRDFASVEQHRLAQRGGFGRRLEAALHHNALRMIGPEAVTLTTEHLVHGVHDFRQSVFRPLRQRRTTGGRMR